MGRIKILPGDTNNVFPGYIFKSIHIFSKPAVVCETLRVAKPEGLISDVVTAVGKICAGLFECDSHLFKGWCFIQKGVDNLINPVDHFIRCVISAACDVERVYARVDARTERTVDGCRNLFFNQLPVEPAAAIADPATAKHIQG